MSTEKKLLVIIGITGQQGGSVASTFLSSPTLSSTYRLRGITRDPSKHKASLHPSIELVQGDLDDPTSLDRAFADADAIFSNTDFWQFTSDPSSPVHARAAARGVPPNILAYEHELQQGRNVVDAAARAHARRPLQRLVLSTLADCEKWSAGEVRRALHFDSKARYCQYLRASHPELAGVASYVHAGFYLSNMLPCSGFAFWAPYRDPAAPETFVWPTSGLPDAKYPVPFINPPKDMGPLVEALITKAPAQTTLLGCCRSMAFEEYVELWGRTLGVGTRVDYITHEKISAAGLPDWMAIEATDAAIFISKYSWTGGEQVKGPAECGVDMSQLTDLEEWIKEQDWKL